MAYSREEGEEYILMLIYYTFLSHDFEKNVFKSNMLIEHDVNKLIYSVTKI